MILSDNETSIDRLNNMAIAKTIVSIIKDSKESVSIGGGRAEFKFCFGWK